MFIGHYAIGFATRNANNSPSLPIIFIAVQLLDLLWPIFVLFGIESFNIEQGNTVLTPLNFLSYPYSHSLLMAVIWGILFGLIYFAFTRNGRAAILLLPLVVSHWFLDFITHRPDLPLTPFSDLKVGLALWNHPVLEMILEISLFLVGVSLYYKRVKPRRRVAFWTLVSFLFLIHVMNVFGPPPPSITAVAWSANLMWLFVLWAWWIERNPSPKATGREK